MATGKRFYWMKLRESFMTSDTIDYFMAQPDGANYVVLYQMLCLKTINTGGRLSRQLGEIIIPYDVEKIVRDCKWFSPDTVRVALNLYKSVGLIYEDQDGVLALSDYADLVGSGTDWAAQKQRQRITGVDIVHTDVHKLVPGNVHTDIEIDIRDKDKEKEKENKEKEIKDAGVSTPAPLSRSSPQKENPMAVLKKFAGDNESLLAALMDFLTMRKSIKKPITTNRAATMLVNKLQSLSQNPQMQIAILNQSIFHSWQGVFELKDGAEKGEKANGERQGSTGKKWDIKADLD